MGTISTDVLLGAHLLVPGLIGFTHRFDGHGHGGARLFAGELVIGKIVDPRPRGGVALSIEAMAFVNQP